MSTPVNTTDELIQKWHALPPKLQRQVVDFVEFLLNSYRDLKPEDIKSPESNLRTDRTDLTPNSSRVLGIHEGMGSISDDFDNSLPDEFWLGTQ
jgi:hypothetical protein